MTIGEKLYNIRKRNGWSQDYVAAELGVSRQSVSRWELNESIPELDKISKLSKLYSISSDYLINDEDKSYCCTDSNSTVKKSVDKKTVISLIMLIVCVMTIGILWMLSSFIPSYKEVENTVKREDIVFINPSEEDEAAIPEIDVVTLWTRCYEFFPFLSTYHLYWLFGICGVSIVYSIVILTQVVIKSKKHKKNNVLETNYEKNNYK